MIPILISRFRSNAPGRLTAAILFFFLLTQEVGGIAPLKGAVEVALFVIAFGEIRQSFSGVRRAVWNISGLGVLLFILSVALGCLLSPDWIASFGEMRTPILKGMLAIPLALVLCIARLVRLGWGKEEVAALIVFAMACSGFALVVWMLASYVQYYLAVGCLPQDPYFHRYKASAALVTLPFALIGIGFFRFGKWPLMGGIVVGLAIMLLTSGARGAWLGAGVGCCYLYIQLRRHNPGAFAINKWHVFTLVSILAATLLVLSGTPIAQMLAGKAAAGLDTSARAGNGVWGATLEMIWKRPWLGYGYGDVIYDRAYNTLAQLKPDWIFKESIGPHNAILAHWVASGIFGLAAILFLYGSYISTALKLARENRNAPVSLALIYGSVAAAMSSYLVRGQFEIVRWNTFGILVAVVIWLFMVSRGVTPPNTKGENDDARNLGAGRLQTQSVPSES